MKFVASYILFGFSYQGFKISTQNFSEGVRDFCKCRAPRIGSCDMYCVVRFILVLLS